MKGLFRFDPAACRYGAATEAVRQILGEWMAIDWLARASAAAEARAAASFVEHHRRARAVAPDLFEPEVEIIANRGDFKAFSELCGRVRSSSGWDWKFSALKPLSYRHSQERGWPSSSDVAVHVPCVDKGEVPGPGDLVFRLGDGVIWNNIAPELELEGAVAKEHAELVHFYLGYACMDATECLEWQLAEPSARLLDNPFVPLLRCYGDGVLPFALGPGTVVLFAFR